MWCPGLYPRGRSVPTALVALFLVALGSPAFGVELEDPATFQVKRVWSASRLRVPVHLGALLFSPTGDVLYAVGAAETPLGSPYAVSVTRDPATNKVSELGRGDRTVRAFRSSSAPLDSGLHIGPQGTVFYTSWSTHKLGQRAGGVDGPERVFDLSHLGLPERVAGLTFSPHIIDPDTNFGLMQLGTFGGAKDVYNVALIPLDGAIFEPQRVELFATLPVATGTGEIAYIPSGAHAGNLMYLDWNLGTIGILLIDPTTGFPLDDATGLPALGTDNPRVESFAFDLGSGPWGLEFDPVTHDLFVSTWGGSPRDSIIQIVGFPPPAEPTCLTGPTQPIAAREGVNVKLTWKPGSGEQSVRVVRNGMEWPPPRRLTPPSSSTRPPPPACSSTN